MTTRRDHRKSFIFFSSLIVVGLLTFMYAVVWFRCYNNVIMDPFLSKGNWLIFAIYVLFIALFAKIYGGYQVGHFLKGNVIYSSVLSLLFVNLLTYFQISLIGRELMDVIPMIILTVIQTATIVIWTFVANGLYTHFYPPRRLLMIYSGELARSLVLKMSARPEKYIIGQTLSIDVGEEELRKKIHEFDGVVLCDIKAAQRNRLLKYCYSHSIRTYLTPKISDIIIRESANVDLFDTPLLLCPNAGLSPEQALVKRLCDLVLAGIMALLASPIMLIAAIAIKVQDGGPILFKQKRCTIHGKEFYVLKFRSMIVDAEKDGVRPCVNNDPRITPVGKFIRKTRIDELPQLFNILKGEMSIVGPRPERIEHVKAYSEKIPEFRFRLKVKAGLTGYAQIAGKYNTTPYDKLKLDLMYIERYSLLNDIKLMLMTIKILFVKNSTEGFTEAESLTMNKQEKKS
jgi:exopolysaccharide biosynthesis polyprenyl glycosylphosphotransferase